MINRYEQATGISGTPTGWAFYAAVVLFSVAAGLVSSILIDLIIASIGAGSVFVVAPPDTYYRWLIGHLHRHDYVIESLPLWRLGIVIPICFCLLLVRIANPTLDISVFRRWRALIRLAAILAVTYLFYRFAWPLLPDPFDTEFSLTYRLLAALAAALVFGLCMAAAGRYGPAGDFRTDSFWTGVRWRKLLGPLARGAGACLLLSIFMHIGISQILISYFENHISMNMGPTIPSMLTTAFGGAYMYLVSLLFYNWVMSESHLPSRPSAPWAFFVGLTAASAAFGALYLLHIQPLAQRYEAAGQSAAQVLDQLGIPDHAQTAFISIVFAEQEPDIREVEAVWLWFGDDAKRAFSADRASSEKVGALLEQPGGLARAARNQLLAQYQPISARMVWDMEEFERRSLECLKPVGDIHECIWSLAWLSIAPVRPETLEMGRCLAERVRDLPLPGGILQSAIICRRMGCEDMDYWEQQVAAARDPEEFSWYARRWDEYQERIAPQIRDGVIRGRALLGGPLGFADSIHVGITAHGGTGCALGFVNMRLVWAEELAGDGRFEFGNLTDDQRYCLVVALEKDAGLEVAGSWDIEAWEFENPPGIIELGPDRPVADLGEIVIRFAPDRIGGRGD